MAWNKPSVASYAPAKPPRSGCWSAAPSPTPKKKPTAWRGAAALLKYPRSVKIIKLEMAPFRCAKDAVCWAKEHGVVGVMSDADTGGKGVNPDVMVVRLFGCVSFGDIPLWAKVTLKTYVAANEDTKAYSYEISNIEVLKGVAGFVTRPSDKTSMDARILLNGVCDVNGMPLVKAFESEVGHGME